MNTFEKKLRKQILKSTLLLVGFLIIVFVVFMFYSRTYTTKRLLLENNNNIETEFNEIGNQIDKYISSIDKDLYSLNSTDNQFLLNTYYNLLNQSEIEFDISLFEKNNKQNFFSEKYSSHGLLDETYEKLLIDLYLNYGKQMLSYDKQSNYTLFLRDLNEDYIIVKINSIELSKLIHSKTIMYAILDESNQVISTNNDQLISSLSKYTFDLAKERVVFNKLNYSQEVKIIDNDYKIVSLEYDNDNINIVIIVIAMLFLAAIMIIVLSYYSTQLSKNTTKNLTSLLSEIKQIRKGDLNYRLLMETDDEFEIIANDINKMLDEITLLNNRNSELIDLKRLIQIRELEAQFNPHFLYNTLETIRYSILINPNQASELIVQLNKILRYSISNDIRDVKIKDDIKYLRAYLNINKIRFNTRLDYYIDIDEACSEMLVPKLIIQPLIENSIRHNFRFKDHLAIWISINKIDSHLVITVEDNGDGIDSDELAILRSQFNKDMNDGSSIGMYNVNKRLKLLYGDDSKVQIDSRKGIGTIITLSIKVNDV